MKKTFLTFSLVAAAVFILIPHQSPGFFYLGKNDTCGGSDSANFDCYESYYAKLVKEKGIAAAFDDLKAKYKTTSYVIAQCHPLTHVIGRVAALGFNDPAEAFVKGDGFCWSGYYHGVMEGVIEKRGLKNALNNLNDICANIEGKERYSFDYYNCVHGLGHGLMANTEDELFNSLLYCNKLTGSWEQQSCWSGAFMENVIVDGLNHKTKYLIPSKPLYPCTVLKKKYKSTCYLMQTSYVLKITGGDFVKTFNWCKKADAGFENTCYESLGRDASGRSSSNVAVTKAT